MFEFFLHISQSSAKEWDGV